ncbi:MAG: response regulator [Acidobacteriota bacterium]
MRLKILVVDDDVPTLESMREVFTQLGVEVCPVSHSQQAATLINQEKFDGIFLELTMPEVDGFELARQIRQTSWNRRTPIVIVTGQKDRQTIEKAFSAGATFFLQKPIDNDKLTRLLESTRGTIWEERRRYTRISLRTEVTCQVGSRKITGISVNLSQGGLLFQGHRSLAPGNVVQVSFRLPGQKLPINAEGFVLRVDEKRRVGVRFVEMSPEDRQRIGDLVTSQASTR